jgi:phosphoglycolate phosphatase
MTQSLYLDTILFDLDGTLADTAPDLARTLNLLLIERNTPPLPFDQIRPHVSNGAAALVTLGFSLESNAPGFDELRQRFLELYTANLCRGTTLFPGMAELLQQIEQQSMRWGVITNKPARFTEPLMKALGIAARAACIISGDSASKRKPDPEPMLLACSQIGVEPGNCLYIGDARRDIDAGLNAGMQTLVANFGYIGTHDSPADWQAHGIIETPLAIMDWLQQYNRNLNNKRQQTPS